MKIDFDKCGGLVPAIIQDAKTKNVLMLGYMNKEAYDKTVETKKVTFWSRSRNCLWTKGETSGNFLNLVDVKVDCDNDTLLVRAIPDGPTCHKGTGTCWGEANTALQGSALQQPVNPLLFLTELQDFIDRRHKEMPEGSYTTSLFKDGINRIAQKVGLITIGLSGIIYCLMAFLISLLILACPSIHIITIEGCFMHKPRMLLLIGISSPAFHWPKAISS